MSSEADSPRRDRRLEVEAPAPSPELIAELLIVFGLAVLAYTADFESFVTLVLIMILILLLRRDLDRGRPDSE